MRRRALAAVSGAAIAAAFGAFLELRVGGAQTVRDVDDLLTALAALAAALSCLTAGIGSRGGARRFWLLLSLALGAWTAAEVIWAVYDCVLRVAVPVPSWADIGYLGAIPLATAALLSHPAVHGRGLTKARFVLDAVVLATALLFLSWSLVLGPLWRSTDLSSLGGIVAIAYPFGDVVMLFFAVLVIRAMPKNGRFGLWCTLLGFMAMAATDSTYTYLVDKGRYSSGDLIDVGWVVAYLALGLGAVGSRGEALERSRSASKHSDGPSIWSLVTPYVPNLVALAVLAVQVGRGQHLLFTNWGIAVALTFLTLVRQVVAAWDQYRARAGGGRRPPDLSERLSSA